MGQSQYEKKDAQLFAEVRKVQQGNYESYQNIYELSKRCIYKLINDIVQNHYTTEDLMQETYLQIYNKIDTLQDPDKFLSWAGRIATNFAYQYRRKNQRDFVLLDKPDEEEGETVLDKAENEHEAFIPESVLENKEQQRIIAGILEGLSPEQKVCVQYYYYEEMSVNDIARAMDCAPGTVKSRLNYARKALKAAVSQFEVANDVKLYSLASIPVFWFAFRDMAESLVLGDSAAAAVGAAGAGVLGSAGAGSAAGGVGASGAAGVSGGAGVGSAAGSAGAAGSSGVAAGLVSTAAVKAAVVAVTVVVSSAVAVSAASLSERQMQKQEGRVITREEALSAAEELYGSDILTLSSSAGASSGRNGSQTGTGTSAAKTGSTANSSVSAATEEAYEVLEEYVDTDELGEIDEEYLQALSDLAKQMGRTESAIESALTAEQRQYMPDDISEAREMLNYMVESGVGYTALLALDDTDTFRNDYYGELLDMYRQLANIYSRSADFYSKAEVRNLFAQHGGSDLQAALANDGAISDVISGELSESSVNELNAIVEDVLTVQDNLERLTEQMASDPALSQYLEE